MFQQIAQQLQLPIITLEDQLPIITLEDQQIRLTPHTTLHNAPERIRINHDGTQTKYNGPELLLTINPETPEHTEQITKILEKHNVQYAKWHENTRHTTKIAIVWPDPNPKANLIAALQEIHKNG